MKRVALAGIAAALLFVCAPNRAQADSSDENWCSGNHNWSDEGAGYSEKREQRLANASENSIHPGMNGSIRVHGWSNADVLVKACIQTWGPTEGDAKALASQVTIANGPGRIEANGPSSHDHSWWSVSYDIWLPAVSNVEMEAHNGSISLEGVRGKVHFRTLNGSVRMSEVGGEVNGSTTNGSLNLDLAKGGWTGTGMHVETTNGSVRLTLPENFSGQVEASTVNGRVHTDFPVTVSGEIGKTLSFTLGSGGPTIEAKTVNGSVHIGRA